MDNSDIWKFITAALACTVSLSKIGIPAVIAIYKSNYLLALISSCSGAIFGTIIFTYLFSSILNWWKNFKEKMFVKKPTIKNSKFNRKVIKIKQRFGLIGIAILTPIFLSIPIGTFLGEKFYKNKQKVILYISISSIGWCVILYFTYLFFYDTYKSFYS